MADLLTTILLLALGQWIIMIPFGIFFKLGGYPEGAYRMFRIQYFVFYILGPDMGFSRHTKKLVDIKTHSPSYFDDGGKRYYIDRANMARSNGRPAWYYDPRNAFPIPWFTDKGKELDPEKVKRAFKTDIVKQVYHLRDEPKIAKGSPIKYLAYASVALVAMYFIFFILPHMKLGG